jgi:hypothetical protein
MAAPSALKTAPEPPVGADWVRVAYERQMRLLDQVADSGVAITEQAVRITKEAWSIEGVELAALAHARVARSVRLCLMLQTKIIKVLQAHERGEVVAVSTAARSAKSRVSSIVSGIIMSQCDDADRAEQLSQEAAEQLDREDIEHAVASRPFSELVAMICKDLDLELDWAVLADEDWAKAEVASGVVGWPLADRRLTGLDHKSWTAPAPPGAPAPLASRLERGSG